jgi:hypothetical protein
MRRSEREHGLAARFISAYPRIPVAQVPTRSQDVHDLFGLREIGSALAKG